jgi:DNA repair protein RadC
MQRMSAGAAGDPVAPAPLLQATTMNASAVTLRELTVRYAPKRAANGRRVPTTGALDSPESAAAIFTAILRDEPAEVFALLCLSTKHHVIAYHEVSRGTLDATLVHPREVFKAALLANAAGIVVAHNHPSGDPMPSPNDVAVTRRLVQAGELIGIPLIDHLVIGDGAFYSFQREGRL